MVQLLDIIGATIIGGFVLLMISSSNLNISEYSDELLVSTITQFDVVESIEIIESDLYKIGYGIQGSNIVVADSNQITYYTDLTSHSIPEGNGIKDSIRYYFDKSVPLTTSLNPNDYPLYRIENSLHSMQVGRVSNFTLSYYDSLGSELTYSSLSVESNRNKIRSIDLLITYQAAFEIDSTYKTIVLEKKIRPRNLN